VGWVILPWAADLDGDGDVDDDDFAVFKQCYKGSGNEPNSYAGGLGWIADLDCDGDVDGSDYVLFAHCYNGPGNAPRHPMPDTLTAVVLLGSMAQSRVGNPYFFTGRELDLFDFSDANTPQHFTDDVYRLQLYHFRARTMDPVLGRFGQRDLLGTEGNQRYLSDHDEQYGDGVNLYEYVQSTPVNAVDPYGLKVYSYEACCAGKKYDVREKCCEDDKLVDKVTIWQCKRPAQVLWGLIPHCYVCCDGANSNCFSTGPHMTSPGKVKPESSPTGTCSSQKVCPRQKDKKCKNPTADKPYTFCSN